MDEKTLKDKLRELFEKMKEEQPDPEKYHSIIDADGKTIRVDNLFDVLRDWGVNWKCDYDDCYVSFDWPLPLLVEAILELAFEFTYQ